MPVTVDGSTHKQPGGGLNRRTCICSGLPKKLHASLSSRSLGCDGWYRGLMLMFLLFGSNRKGSNFVFRFFLGLRRELFLLNPFVHFSSGVGGNGLHHAKPSRAAGRVHSRRARGNSHGPRRQSGHVADHDGLQVHHGCQGRGMSKRRLQDNKCHHETVSSFQVVSPTLRIGALRLRKDCGEYATGWKRPQKTIGLEESQDCCHVSWTNSYTVGHEICWGRNLVKILAILVEDLTKRCHIVGKTWLCFGTNPQECTQALSSLHVVEYFACFADVFRLYLGGGVGKTSRSSQRDPGRVGGRAAELDVPRNHLLCRGHPEAAAGRGGQVSGEFCYCPIDITQ